MRSKANHRRSKAKKKVVNSLPPGAAAATNWPSVRTLRGKFKMNRKLFSRLTGFSERAVADWENDKPPCGPSRQRLAELQRLQQALARIIKPDFVGEWLQSPNQAFGGLKPLEVIERGEVDRLWQMIYEVESGSPT